ncbi:MAG TPA: helix-turn-helix domain-containing protein [Candidatus Nanoarchaeia archaeon]|nr:helix-turn-helix domain-containing protein [Candidatus Nanoarchaeia archaeon]
MEALEDKLRKAGLTGNGAKVYLELLKRGSISANELAKKISMDRTLAYTVLNHLIDKGLVNYVIKEKKKFFEAASPENLLNSIKRQETFVKDLVPELKQLEKIKPTIHEISVYEGKEGIRSMVRELMKHKSFLAFGATGRLYDLFYEAPALAKEMEKKGLKGRIIMDEKYRSHPATKMTRIMQVRYLNVESEATTTIFEDKIAIHLIKEKPIIIVIKNKEIAEGYTNYFEVLWKTAEK